MVNEMEREAYLTTKIDKPMWEQEENGGSQLGVNVEIPNDLVSRNFVIGSFRQLTFLKLT